MNHCSMITAVSSQYHRVTDIRQIYKLKHDYNSRRYIAVAETEREPQTIGCSHNPEPRPLCPPRDETSQTQAVYKVFNF